MIHTSGGGNENFSFVHLSSTFLGYRTATFLHIKSGVGVGAMVLRPPADLEPVERGQDRQTHHHSELFMVASCLSQLTYAKPTGQLVAFDFSQPPCYVSRSGKHYNHASM